MRCHPLGGTCLSLGGALCVGPRHLTRVEPHLFLRFHYGGIDPPAFCRCTEQVASLDSLGTLPHTTYLPALRPCNSGMNKGVAVAHGFLPWALRALLTGTTFCAGKKHITRATRPQTLARLRTCCQGGLRWVPCCAALSILNKQRAVKLLRNV